MGDTGKRGFDGRRFHGGTKGKQRVGSVGSSGSGGGSGSGSGMGLAVGFSVKGKNGGECFLPRIRAQAIAAWCQMGFWLSGGSGGQ